MTAANEVGRLRQTLVDAADKEACSLDDLTVLHPKNDPFRVDTPAGHRDGKWLADAVDQFLGTARTIHLRGLHYVLATLAVPRPASGSPKGGRPLLDSADSFADQTRRLVASKEYGELP
jgi:hypothetical protein